MPGTRPASLWTRFWSPTSLLERVPPGASDEEAEAVARRNDVWLKTYMDMYILRWGALWAASVVVALLLAELGGPLFGLALIGNLAALVGLARMISIYRRASWSVSRRGPRDR
ncbi:hypothetical protein QTH87_24825 [Variovorax sp. J22P168]|uniref:hypothetical protein n=1 Tax=Variovorax jilinensis TaxID=3053513 RepID=UPI002578D890|nr:hypothetical protein [Variovorax sp. J22P168]MDM0015686.1 hypothetical protein [Variovorax sp. J22P168]